MDITLSELLTKYKNGTLTDEHKDITISDISNVSSVEYFPPIVEKLTLQSVNINMYFFNILTNVKELVLLNCNTSKHCINSLPEVISIVLNGGHIVSESIRYAPKLTKMVIYSETTVDNNSVYIINNGFRTLKELELRRQVPAGYVESDYTYSTGPGNSVKAETRVGSLAVLSESGGILKCNNVSNLNAWWNANKKYISDKWFVVNTGINKQSYYDTSVFFCDSSDSNIKQIPFNKETNTYYDYFNGNLVKVYPHMIYTTLKKYAYYDVIANNISITFGNKTLYMPNTGHPNADTLCNEKGKLYNQPSTDYIFTFSLSMTYNKPEKRYENVILVPMLSVLRKYPNLSYNLYSESDNNGIVSIDISLSESGISTLARILSECELAVDKFKKNIYSTGTNIVSYTEIDKEPNNKRQVLYQAYARHISEGKRLIFSYDEIADSNKDDKKYVVSKYEVIPYVYNESDDIASGDDYEQNWRYNLTKNVAWNYKDGRQIAITEAENKIYGTDTFDINNEYAENKEARVINYTNIPCSFTMPEIVIRTWQDYNGYTCRHTKHEALINIYKDYFIRTGVYKHRYYVWSFIGLENFTDNTVIDNPDNDSNFMPQIEPIETSKYTYQCRYEYVFEYDNESKHIVDFHRTSEYQYTMIPPLIYNVPSPVNPDGGDDSGEDEPVIIIEQEPKLYYGYGITDAELLSIFNDSSRDGAELLSDSYLHGGIYYPGEQNLLLNRQGINKIVWFAYPDDITIDIPLYCAQEHSINSYDFELSALSPVIGGFMYSKSSDETKKHFNVVYTFLEDNTIITNLTWH